MATSFLFSNPLSPSFTLPSVRVPQLRSSPVIQHAGHREPRGAAVVTRAGPSTSNFIFAFTLPLSLLAITVFTSLRIGYKLDQDFLEEMAMNEALMEAEEDIDDEDDIDDDDMKTSLQEPLQQEPALPRTRNRPKREV
ncbi:uncharacterized protein LOC130747386 [Lotus japonicus]|uniref:uncharacterized protein LOC130747386 n=1 Tax=Lotus japonicus TaxID=34305 RepID=UPI002587AF6C|nr:uncharacterized protein LOC130747386 [Lotus japonicus]